MSFFDDDFYSTKVSMQRKPDSRGWHTSWSRRWIGQGLFPGNWIRERTLTALALAAAAGAILTAAGFLAFTDHEAAPAMVVSSSASDGFTQPHNPVVHVAAMVMPTVVSIIRSAGDKPPGGSVQGDLGSGVIFEKNGSRARIVTNSHVVSMAEQMEVVLANGEHKKAKLVGSDMITDVAVIEVDASGIERVAEFGDSDLLKPGETAVAIGNPLGLGYSQSITAGIISWPNRKIPVSFNNDGTKDWEFDVIQTDAAINQGNSGGALVDLNGKVIGINSMKISDTGIEGLGFAIPINQVKQTIDSLIQYGKVKRPFLGVTTVEYNPNIKGVSTLKLPQEVKSGLIVLETVDPSKEAGLTTNDVIVELDSQPVGTTLALRKYLYEKKKIGDKLIVTYYRGAKKLTVTLTLGESK